MIKRSILTIATIFIAACSSVGHYKVDTIAEDKADMQFVGIPIFAGAIGSSFPVTEKYSLTAGHVAKVMMVKVKAYNKVCDIALIYHDNRGRELPTTASAVSGDRINIYGYNAYTTLPTSSTGTVKEFGWWKKPDTSCYVALSDAGGIQGMSGGPVYGASGDVVGVLTATHRQRNQTIFVPYQDISAWVAEETKT